MAMIILTNEQSTHSVFNRLNSKNPIDYFVASQANVYRLKSTYSLGDENRITRWKDLLDNFNIRLGL